MTYRAIEMIATFYDYKMDALISFPILFTKLDCNLFFHATQPLVVSKVGGGGRKGEYWVEGGVQTVQVQDASGVTGWPNKRSFRLYSRASGDCLSRGVVQSIGNSPHS